MKTAYNSIGYGITCEQVMDSRGNPKTRGTFEAMGSCAFLRPRAGMGWVRGQRAGDGTNATPKNSGARPVGASLPVSFQTTGPSPVDAPLHGTLAPFIMRPARRLGR